MARAAELNGYPGPLHVLELGDQLGLTETQRQQVGRIYDRMSTAAKALGGKLIALEHGPDQFFAAGNITLERVTAETAAIGELEGRLRAVHLSAHLESADQIARYQQLRGYADPTGLGHHG